MEHHVQARAVHKRARILDATMATALAGGLGAVTHRAVSEAAQVSLSAIRYYFRTREELLLAFIEEADQMRAREASAVIETLDGPVSDASVVARLLLRSYYGADLSDGELAGILRVTVECSRETPQIAASLARLREDAVNPQLTQVLTLCGWSTVDASLASAVLDGSILASTAEARRGIAERAIAALAQVLEMSKGTAGTSRPGGGV